MAAFVIRIFKSWGARDPERRWVNTYEFNGVTLTTPASYEDLVGDLVHAEQLLHLPGVQFLEATVSTWLPDSHPYDPDAFNTFDLAVTGLRSTEGVTSGQVMDSNVCLLVKRRAVSGRSGKLFYRGCLAENDTEVGGDGHFSLSAGGILTNTGSAFTAYKAAMAPFLVGGEGDAALALISKIAGVTHVRPVVELVSSGVTVSQRNHRYFDRHAA